MFEFEVGAEYEVAYRGMRGNMQTYQLRVSEVNERGVQGFLTAATNHAGIGGAVFLRHSSIANRVRLYGTPVVESPTVEPDLFPVHGDSTIEILGCHVTDGNSYVIYFGGYTTPLRFFVEYHTQTRLYGGAVSTANGYPQGVSTSLSIFDIDDIGLLQVNAPIPQREVVLPRRASSASWVAPIAEPNRPVQKWVETSINLGVE